MSFLGVNTDVVAAAATRLEGIGSTINDAYATAAAFTTNLVPAAEDEISTAIAALFGSSAQSFHGLAAQAAAFHKGFIQALNAGVKSYVAAEGTNAGVLAQTAQQGLAGAINAPAQALLGRPLLGTGAGPLNAAEVVQLYGAGPIPENAYPFGGIKQLSFTASVNEALQVLDYQVRQALAVPGTTVSIYGYSQSAVVVSLEMANLQAQGVPSSNASFFIVGNPMNPNGGFFERFAGLQLPSIGMDFYGATPSNAYPTTMVTIEYDSWADFPQYPLNILADLNAISSLNHFYYHVLTAQQIDGAIVLPTSGPTQTRYLMIPATQLPLLNPVRDIPFIGNPVADLLQPDLTYLVNMGYGDPRYGWSTGPANVPTQAGLFPPLHAYQELPGLLQSGAQQGVHDFVGDLSGTGPNPVTLPTLSSLSSLLNPSTLTNSLTSLLGPSATGGAASAASVLSTLSANPAALGPLLSATAMSAVASAPIVLGNTVTTIANTVSTVGSGLYSIALPTADVLTAAFISIPSYDVNLFLDGILQALNGDPVGGLINAFGQPIASDVGLYTWLLNLEVAAISDPQEAAGPSSGVPSIGIG